MDFDNEFELILINGAIRFLDEGITSSGNELSFLLLDYYKKKEQPVSKDNIEKILQIFAHYPESKERTKFIKHSIIWSQNKENNNQASPDLLSVYSKAFYKEKNYDLAQSFFIRSNEIKLFAQMIFEWKELGYPGEHDLFFTRAILSTLAIGNVQNSKLLFREYMKLIQNSDQPLYNFCRLLILVLEREALPMFNQLKSSYEIELKRDSSFQKYLDQIAFLFFGIKKQSNFFNF